MKRKLLISLIFMLAICSAQVFAQDALKKWQKIDFAKTLVKKTDLNKMDVGDLSLVRGIVFGKHGRIFKEQFIQDYLSKQAWYKPNKDFNNKLLTANERKNIDLIREAEAVKHDSIQPGDLRFWQTKEFTTEQIYANTAAEWRVMIAEVEAIHGKTFADEPWLQKYFEERYWYKPNPNYNPSVLSEIEKKNITTLMTARGHDRKVAVSPGDMDKFQNAPLSEDLLKGATLNDLRIMRNEFWARRGKAFTTPGFKAFYEFQDWYKPLKDQSKVKLNETEKANVALIQNYENKLRERIASEILEPETFQGLFVEDLRVLRNEIYARHGRIFKNAELQKTFDAMPWYKPNPEFKDEMLSETESKNLVSIRQAEADAVSKFALVEG
ncbi:MAG: YARHG domain-containing protein [Acidobacteriota bacterium]|nr:YARHG domain-containing protein [Acidobacteriota bacterium]